MAAKDITYGNFSHVFTSYRISINRMGFSSIEVFRRNIIDTLTIYLYIIIGV